MVPFAHEKIPDSAREQLSLPAYASGPREGSGWRLQRPGDLTGATVGQIRDLPGAGCGDSGFDRRVRLFAALDAVEEVLHVVDGAVAEGVGLEDGIVFGWHAFAIDAKSRRLSFRVASVPRNSRPPSSMEEAIMPS